MIIFLHKTLFLITVLVLLLICFFGFTGCTKRSESSKPPTEEVVVPTVAPAEPYLPVHTTSSCPVMVCPTIVPVTCQTVVCAAPTPPPPNVVQFHYQEEIKCSAMATAIKDSVTDPNSKKEVHYLDQLTLVHPHTSGSVGVMRRCYILKTP